MSILRDKVKAIFKQKFKELQSNSEYKLGTVTQKNDDGTCQVFVTSGAEYKALPLYPVVIGQEVVAIFTAGGRISAYPTSPNVPVVEFIPPPFFTGGKLRFMSVSFKFPIDSSPVSIKFQDQGSSNLYVYTPSELVLSGIVSKFVFSPNGKFYAHLSDNGTNYQIHCVEIGDTLKSDGEIDKDRKVFALKGATEKFSFTQADTVNLGNPVTVTALIEKQFKALDVWVDNKGNVYWLEIQVDTWNIAFANQTSDLFHKGIIAPLTVIARTYKYDGTTKTTVTQLTLVSVGVNIVPQSIIPPRPGWITLHYQQSVPVPIGLADPLQGLLLGGAPGTSGQTWLSVDSFYVSTGAPGFIFNAWSVNIQSSSSTSPATTNANDTNSPQNISDFNATDSKYSQNTIPAIMDGNTGLIIAKGTGVLGSSSVSNHNDIEPIGKRILTLSSVLNYFPNAIVNSSKVIPNGLELSNTIWYIDDVSLKVFAFKITKDTEKDIPIVKVYSVSNSILDLNMDLNENFSDFLRDYVPKNFFLFGKFSGLVECGGILSTIDSLGHLPHSINPMTHRHIRRAKIDKDTLVVTIIDDSKKVSSVSPGDPGGYPGEGIDPKDFSQWRNLYSPSFGDGVQENLLSVAIIK